MERLKIKVDHVILDGDLSLPDQPKGIVIFSHGSGSSRFSPRNNLVAQYLNKMGFGTFLFDGRVLCLNNMHNCFLFETIPTNFLEW